MGRLPQELITAWYQQMWNCWDKAIISDICSEDIRFRGSLGETVFGHSGVASYMDQVRQAFPDFKNVVEEFISEDARAFARLTYTGTHQGPVLGFPPTGRKVVYSGAAVFAFHGGRIVDVWVLGDLYSLVRQLSAET